MCTKGSYLIDDKALCETRFLYAAINMAATASTTNCRKCKWLSINRPG